MARIYTEQELQNFQASEKELRTRHLVVDEEDGKTEMTHNSERILAFFELNPETPVTVATILQACEQMKDQLHWLSQAEVAYNAAYRSLSKAEQDQFGAWWFTSGKKYVDTDGEHGFENATKIITWSKGRSFSPTTFDLAVSNLASSQGLHFQTVKAQPNPRKHADDGQGFMPKDHQSKQYRGGKKNHASEEPGTVKHPPKDMDPTEAKWREMASALRGNTHSQTAALEQIVGPNWRRTYELRKQYLNRNVAISNRMGTA